ncbi:NUDIX domain-containing protein [Candidatus Gottesmanbacteria bacterium]|nr:NUDIX domain-containing protein [Candidatus Gottesmanbacteria bacterium]
MAKSINEAYHFCPLCGEKFQKKEPDLLVCKSCGFHYFINPRPCNAAIISDEKGNILLVKRKYEPKKDFWDLPGGFMSPDENIDVSAKREIREELGVEIEITGIVGGFADSYEYQGIVYPTYTTIVAAKIIKGEIRPTDDVSDVAFYTKEEVFQLNIAFPSLLGAVRVYFS